MNTNRHPVPAPRPAAEAHHTWSRLTESVRARRAERAAEAALRRDLAVYDTPSAIADLMAAAERHQGPDAELVQQILSDNLVGIAHRSAP